MADIKPPSNLKEIPLAIVSNMIVLAASGFGVVVALSWNDFVRLFVASYVDPYLGRSGTLVSLLIYACVITVVAVLVTMQLTYLQQKLEQLQDKVARRKTANKDTK